jgi:hypothetical protein
VAHSTLCPPPSQYNLSPDSRPDRRPNHPTPSICPSVSPIVVRAFYGPHLAGSVHSSILRVVSPSADELEWTSSETQNARVLIGSPCEGLEGTGHPADSTP